MTSSGIAAIAICIFDQSEFSRPRVAAHIRDSPHLSESPESTACVPRSIEIAAVSDRETSIANEVR
jgi:hypothetical protein